MNTKFMQLIQLELLGADISERRMPTSPIVPDFDPRENGSPRQFARLKRVFFDDLELQHAEETFHDRIIPTICFAAHVGHEALPLVKALHRVGSVLRTLSE